MAVVTIRGQLGSGAPEIGRLIAGALGGDYIDRQIIARVAERICCTERFVVEKEMPPGSLFGRIAEALGRSGLTLDRAPYLPTWDAPLGDALYLSGLRSVITELAGKQPVVIQGRGSQYILKDTPHSLHLLVVAPRDLRVERVACEMNIDKDAAVKEINRIDNSRREFIKRYFDADPEDPTHYDLVLNTSRLSYDATASVAVQAAKFVE